MQLMILHNHNIDSTQSGLSFYRIRILILHNQNNDYAESKWWFCRIGIMNLNNHNQMSELEWNVRIKVPIHRINSRIWLIDSRIKMTILRNHNQNIRIRSKMSESMCQITEWIPGFGQNEKKWLMESNECFWFYRRYSGWISAHPLSLTH